MFDFAYNGNFCKQLHGYAMGAPVSTIVTNLYMEHFESLPLQSYDKNCYIRRTNFHTIKGISVTLIGVCMYKGIAINQSSFIPF